MPSTEDLLKNAVGDLPTTYLPPHDPYQRVAEGVRRRRNRRRLSAAGAGAVVAALAVAVPLLLPTRAPDGAGASNVAAPPATIDAGTPLPGYDAVPAGPVYKVGAGTHRGVDWTVGSVAGKEGQSCLVSRNVMLGKIAACFVEAEGVQRVHWAATQPFDDKQFAVVGIAPRSVASVRVTLADGSVTQAPAVTTPTSGAVRFFTVLVPTTPRQDAGVQALDTAGKPLGGPVSVDPKASFKNNTPPFCATGGAHPENGPTGNDSKAPGIGDVTTGVPCGVPWTYMRAPDPWPSGSPTPTK
ncbi:hypothetical protein OG625_20235 [Streptomyces sp. NBC_01351]|uniref:hypothetical protein n=1 Tax=Streptomyces sp. NBC_01351 TaxID=2903833 RepID=UPI002E33FBA3|nr:hypothetical protein [Streptomyces sp. NBC_01351]